jgi:Dyp-type peroxidase family
MVLRAGYKVGPGRPWDVAGAGAGAAAVVIFALFVGLAPRPAGYSSYSDPISRLGAFGTPGQWWFTAVNLAEAALITVFAYGVQRRVPVGLVGALLLGAVAPGSLVVSYPCSDPCRPTGVGVHNVGASYTAVMIVTMMIAVGWGAYRHARRWIRPATLACSTANVVAFVFLLLAIYGPLGGMGLWERLFWATAYLWVLLAAGAIVEATRRRPPVPGVDPSIAQDKIVRSSRSWTHAVYLLAAIEDADEAKVWLAGASHLQAGPRPASLTIAFTHQGLEALDVGYRDNPSEAFVAGMKARAKTLGDQGPSAPPEWEEPWRSAPIHLLAWIEASSGERVDAEVERVRKLPGAAGLVFYPPQAATAGAHGRRERVELLGFRDGISQPWLRFDGSEDPPPSGRGGGVLDAFGDLRPVAAGEFVLGVEDESGAVAPVPHPRAVFDRGSYLVVRKLAQDVRREMDGIATATGHHGAPTFTERIVGRRRDGEPLEPVPPRGGLNEFLYSGDPEGRHCPLGSHIRRANPRDSLGFGSLLSARHRIIRRGKLFRDDGLTGNRGLMFLAVNARIEDQFEFVQRLWLNDGSRQRVGATPDLIAGKSRPEASIVLQGVRLPEVSQGQPGLVRTLGGEYFFVPSKAGLQALIAAPAASG